MTSVALRQPKSCQIVEKIIVIVLRVIEWPCSHAAPAQDTDTATKIHLYLHMSVQTIQLIVVERNMSHRRDMDG